MFSSFAKALKVKRVEEEDLKDKNNDFETSLDETNILIDHVAEYMFDETEDIFKDCEEEVDALKEELDDQLSHLEKMMEKYARSIYNINRQISSNKNETYSKSDDDGDESSDDEGDFNSDDKFDDISGDEFDDISDEEENTWQSLEENKTINMNLPQHLSSIVVRIPSHHTVAAGRNNFVEYELEIDIALGGQGDVDKSSDGHYEENDGGENISDSEAKKYGEEVEGEGGKDNVLRLYRRFSQFRELHRRMSTNRWYGQDIARLSFPKRKVFFSLSSSVSSSRQMELKSYLTSLLDTCCISTKEELDRLDIFFRRR